jgi:hypothetical protein
MSSTPKAILQKLIGAIATPLAFGIIITLSAHQAQAQWLEPTRLHIGMSGGFGGVHAWGKPSFDLIYGRLTARIAPGLHYMSGGLTYQFAYFNPKVRHDRILILSLYYHNDWLLANKKRAEFRRDQHLWMLMPGIHVNLDHRGTIFFQVSAGAMYQHERIFNQDKTLKSVGDHFTPMGEVRIGGIFLSRKEHVQQFPHYHKEKPAKKIQKKKLKFK